MDTSHILVDDQDRHLLDTYHWNVYRIGKVYYAMTQVAGKRVYLHQMICPAEPPLEVDHKDGNGLNNRRDNLEAVTHAVNIRRARWRKPSPWGRNIQPMGKKFQVRVWVNMRPIHVGTFATIEEAVAARDEFRATL